MRFQQLTLEEGLSQTTVNAIHQDQQGFMWFGTEDGLNRYDGGSFTVFKHDSRDPTSIGHSWVWAIAEDAQGSLWVGTNGGGLNRWNPVDGSFRAFVNDSQDPVSLSDDRVRTLHLDRNGALWVGTEQGLNRYEPESKTFVVFRHDPNEPTSLSDDFILDLAEDHQGRLWVATRDGGLNRLDAGGSRFHHYRHDPNDENSLSEDYVRCVLEDRDGFLWLGTQNGGLNRFDATSETFVHYRHDPDDPASLGHDTVRSLWQDSQGTLWVGTQAGLNRWQSGTTRFVRYQENPGERRSFSGGQGRSLFQDRGGVIWIGTQSGGVNWFNPLTASFPHIKRIEGTKSTLSANGITSFFDEADDRLWVGTLGGGLNLVDRSTGTFTHYLHDPEDPTSLNDDNVMALVVDSRGILWVGTMHGGLDRFDRADETFHHYVHDPSDPTSLSSEGVMSLIEDKEGTIWAGTYGGGLDRFDREHGTFVHYRHDDSDPESISHDQATALCEDSEGDLWVGTLGGGLNRFDRIAETFAHYRADPENLDSLANDVVMSIYEDPEGNLWIGMLSGGLDRWLASDRAAGRAVFKRYSERDGLPSDWVYGILSDDSGDLWLSTNGGLARLDPRSETITKYTTSHGLQSAEFNFGAYHRSRRTGEMFFGGINGFNAFFPREIRRNAHVPRVALTAFLKANQPVEFDRPIWEVDAVEIGYRDSVVSFEFAALDFTAPDQNSYAYMLEGFDEGWNEVGTLRRATYTNLDAGRYTLRVRASNNDGVWNQEGISIGVRVIPPPWKSKWAFTAYVIVLVAAVFGFVRVQTRKLKREEEYSRKLEVEVKERTRELEEASLTDALTGLRNRRYLMTYIHEDLALVDRYYRDQKPKVGTGRLASRDFLFLMIDLDGLKKINDVHGHRAGDAAIVQMRDILKRCCRETDTLIRLGGDEFLVVSRDVDRESAEIVAERIRKRVRDHTFELEDRSTLQLSCSIGFAFYPFLPKDPTHISGEQVLSIADHALYLSKSSGRNAWVGIHATQTPAPDDFMARINDGLEPLVREGQLELSTSIEEGGLVWAREDGVRR